MNNIVWFRNDLRVQDNTSLYEAMKGEKVIGFYCFESIYFKLDKFGFKRTEKFRAKFLIETVLQLKKELEKLNIPLFIYYGETAHYLAELVRDHKINSIFLQKEWTRDEKMIVDAVQKKVPVKTRLIACYDQFLFHPDDIPYPDFKSIPEVFTHFRKKCENKIDVRPVKKINKEMPKANLVNNPTNIPTMNDLGLKNKETDPRTAFPFKGGELEALNRVQHYFWETNKLAFYKKTRNGLVGKDYSSKLSAWLANGSISARTIFWEVKRFEEEITKNQDTYWLIFELIWRDYFKYVSLKHESNIFKIGGILKKDYTWKNDTLERNEWIYGTTKEPFVNANMKELALTGWMSNRGRQNVASFWSKELQQDWRIGAAYFESMLIDYDIHSNWGNWMYNSGVGNDPRDRKFNIKTQAARYDSSGKFQNLWLQETLF